MRAGWRRASHRGERDAEAASLYLATVSVPPKVDLRILQANERTLLAWIRTGLGLMAFGFVLARMGVWLQTERATGADAASSIDAGVAFIALGTLCHPIAALRFVRARRAIIAGRDMIPGAGAAVALALGVTVLGAMLIGYLLLR